MIVIGVSLLTLFPAEFEDEYTPSDALLKGLDDLNSLCNVIQEKFTAARDGFARTEG